MTKGVTIRRYQPPRDATAGTAQCQGCDQLPAECSRERARQHVKKTGHTVRYTVEQIWIYEPDGSLFGRTEDAATGSAW